jgi:hypothetical protein
MKKRNPSYGQNGQLVHYGLLIVMLFVVGKNSSLGHYQNKRLMTKVKGDLEFWYCFDSLKFSSSALN